MPDLDLCHAPVFLNIILKESSNFFPSLNCGINKRHFFLTSHFISQRKYHQSMSSLRSSSFLLFSLSNLFLHQNNEFGVGFQTACEAKTLNRPYIQVHARELFETSCCCCSCLWQWQWLDYLLLFLACSMIRTTSYWLDFKPPQIFHQDEGLLGQSLRGVIASRWKTCLPVLLTCNMAVIVRMALRCWLLRYCLIGQYWRCVNC